MILNLSQPTSQLLCQPLVKCLDFLTAKSMYLSNREISLSRIIEIFENETDLADNEIGLNNLMEIAANEFHPYSYEASYYVNDIKSKTEESAHNNIRDELAKNLPGLNIFRRTRHS